MSIIYHIAPKRSGHALVKHLIREWLPGVCIVDLENKDPGRLRLRDKTVVLQTRDLLNWTASVIMHKARRRGVEAQYITYRDIHTLLQAWRAITHEFYTPKHLPHCTLCRVKFEHLITQTAYRHRVHNELVVTVAGKNSIAPIYTENALRRVREDGGGSSFDGRAYDGCAEDMKVMTRYRQLPQGCHRLYQQMFEQNTDLLDLYLHDLHHCDINSEDQEAFLQELNVSITV